MPIGNLLDLIVCTECKTRVEYHDDRDGYMSCECFIRDTADDPMPGSWIEIDDRKVNECGGCRANIPERSVFRCADCGLPFHQVCLDQHCKHGNQKQELRSNNIFLKQQVDNLEEYMLKGVAFRDELQGRIGRLEEAINKHRCAIWGVGGKVAHDQDIILYAALAEQGVRGTRADVGGVAGE